MKKINHIRNASYPNSKYTADFLINNKFVEFFGLIGENQKYNKNIKEKEKITKKHEIKLIKIYPKDLFPNNNLEKVLQPILKNYTFRCSFLVKNCFKN